MSFSLLYHQEYLFGERLTPLQTTQKHSNRRYRRSLDKHNCESPLPSYVAVVFVFAVVVAVAFVDVVVVVVVAVVAVLVSLGTIDVCSGFHFSCHYK